MSRSQRIGSGEREWHGESGIGGLACMDTVRWKRSRMKHVPSMSNDYVVEGCVATPEAREPDFDRHRVGCVKGDRIAMGSWTEAIAWARMRSHVRR
jgi:hypothetical protein